MWHHHHHHPPKRYPKCLGLILHSVFIVGFFIPLPNSSFLKSTAQLLESRSHSITPSHHSNNRNFVSMPREFLSPTFIGDPEFQHYTREGEDLFPFFPSMLKIPTSFNYSLYKKECQPTYIFLSLSIEHRILPFSTIFFLRNDGQNCNSIPTTIDL